MKYALCELVRPLTSRDINGYTEYAFVVREVGNKNRMRCLMLSNGGRKSGWITSFGNATIGEFIWCGKNWIPDELMS